MANSSTRNQIDSDISTDDRLRSQYMKNLIKEDLPISHTQHDLAIPHLLVQFWDDIETIPSDIQKCIDSWKSLEKYGFQRLLFDDKTAIKFIKENYDKCYLDAFNKCGHPAMRSDYFRLCFIALNGGLYVDVDDVYKGGDFEHYFFDSKLKLQPLCYNLRTNSMVKITDSHDSQELIFYVNNNPIIAPPNHPVLREALERSTQILLSQKADDKQDIQSITGPGNMTICLVRHAVKIKVESIKQDFTFLTDWDEISVSQWPLDYRHDKRNWRLWDGFKNRV